MRNVTRRLCPFLAVLALAAPAASSLAAAGSDQARRAVEILEAGALPPGELEVLAELQLEDADSEPESAELAGELAVLVSNLGSIGDGERWRIILAAGGADAAPQVAETVVAWPDGASGSGWLSASRHALPLDFDEAVVVVEALVSGRTGAAWVDLAADLPTAPPGYVVLSAGSEGRTAAGATGAAVEADRGGTDSVLRLVAPAERPLVGRARFRVVTTTDAVRKVVFYLDGEETATDERPAFSALLDLGAEPRPHEIRAVALGRGDLVLGEDRVTINLEAQPFRVRISEVREVGPALLRVAVDVSVPPGERLSAVEIYRNDELLATLEAPPFTVELAGRPQPTEFVRAVARLASGEEREDAQLLAGGTIAERVEVNLVEVYAVVTERDGVPVTDLERDRFRLRQGRREIPIEGFGPADEVPLVLGLIVDSSESMYPLMVETQQAAASFFSETVRSGDRGYLVDFDTRPRLAQALTADLAVLLRGLQALRPGGNTAIYDAAIFSLGQFEDQPGRRALVLLTDGRDYGSRFRPSQVVEEARRLGVPIYVIVLNNLGLMPEAWRQRELEPPPVDANLETLVLKSGGRLFNLAGTEPLAEVYRTINLELRSQYLVTFSTQSPLSAKELAALRIEVEGKGLEVRTVTLDR